ncbi:MAG: DUF6361 family protein [Desulfobacterales bacterium]|nr:DUF6361 family protein [Desulfobacterales bacterium]
MVSKFGWIDFSEKERRQMLDVVQLFSERDTRDELGIGTIRDAFSDHFFPGTSTIQTRPKYMLLIPWMYIDFEKRRTASAQIGARARKFETDLIFTLLKNGNAEGVIGKDAKKNLVRLASNIYWAGLRSWGIRRFVGSQEQYHRSLDFYYKAGSLVGEEADEEFGDLKRFTNWHPGIPEPSKDFKQHASLELSANEADYLKERVLMLYPDSFFAQLLREKRFVKADYPWEHPVVRSLSPELSRSLLHARNFSEVIHGAALYYNLMLSEAAERQDWSESFNQKMEEWKAGLGVRYVELTSWYRNLEEFWMSQGLNTARIPTLTKAFVQKWLYFVFESPGMENLLGDRKVQDLIASREFQLKGPRARLSNRNALNRWRGESGTGRLIYRWGIASVFVSDILKAKNVRPAHA